jgi:hypothetical protein
VLSAGCVLWLERFQPLFATIAVATLAYQGWLVWKRPPQRRTRRALFILWTSVAVTGLVFATWIGLWVRYR